jgi:hypothetical protein
LQLSNRPTAQPPQEFCSMLMGSEDREADLWAAALSHPEEAV